MTVQKPEQDYSRSRQLLRHHARKSEYYAVSMKKYPPFIKDGMVRTLSWAV
ncbi:hypothetical protein AAC03nite_34800 [Alicyclobacillus acidoterrestris]|nr:hypothetical protein AAC03nite_34800 [Alicyclobacillus acidoterrestris]